MTPAPSKVKGRRVGGSPTRKAPPLVDERHRPAGMEAKHRGTFQEQEWVTNDGVAKAKDGKKWTPDKRSRGVHWMPMFRPENGGTGRDSPWA